MVALHYNFMVYCFLLQPVLLSAVLLVLPRLDITSILDSASDTFSSEPHFAEASSLPWSSDWESGRRCASWERGSPLGGSADPLPWGGVVNIALDWVLCLVFDLDWSIGLICTAGQVTFYWFIVNLWAGLRGGRLKKGPGSPCPMAPALNQDLLSWSPGWSLFLSLHHLNSSVWHLKMRGGWSHPPHWGEEWGSSSTTYSVKLLQRTAFCTPHFLGGQQGLQGCEDPLLERGISFGSWEGVLLPTYWGTKCTFH